MNRFHLPKSKIENLRTVIFDWDGCLVRNFQLSYECYKRAFRIFGLEIDKETFKKNYSPNWLEMYKNFEIEKNTWIKINKVWLKIYKEKKVSLCKGAKELLIFLDKYKIKRFLLSGGSRKRVSNELRYYSLFKLFSLMVCQEDCIYKKPNPKLLLQILDYTNFDKKEVVFIGDTHYDAIMGKNANIETIIVKSGYSIAQKILAIGPYYFANSLFDVKSILKKIITDVDSR